MISGQEAEQLMNKKGLSGIDVSDRHIDIYLADGSSIDITPVATFELQILHTTYLPTDIVSSKKIIHSKNKLNG
jgi:hypothetical protein